MASGDVFLMKVRDVIKLIAADGWYLARTRGSHRQFRHFGLVIVPPRSPAKLRNISWTWSSYHPIHVSAYSSRS